MATSNPSSCDNTKRRTKVAAAILTQGQKAARHLFGLCAASNVNNIAGKFEHPTSTAELSAEARRMFEVVFSSSEKKSTTGAETRLRRKHKLHKQSQLKTRENFSSKEEKSSLQEVTSTSKGEPSHLKEDTSSYNHLLKQNRFYCLSDGCEGHDAYANALANPPSYQQHTLGDYFSWRGEKPMCAPPAYSSLEKGGGDSGTPSKQDDEPEPASEKADVKRKKARGKRKDIRENERNFRAFHKAFSAVADKPLVFALHEQKQELAAIREEQRRLSEHAMFAPLVATINAGDIVYPFFTVRENSVRERIESFYSFYGKENLGVKSPSLDYCYKHRKFGQDARGWLSPCAYNGPVPAASKAAEQPTASSSKG